MGAAMPDLVVIPYGKADRYCRFLATVVVGLIAFYGFR